MISLRRKMQVLLSVGVIWFRDIFKIIGKNHQCRRIASSVSQNTASRIHEEMDRGANGNGAVTGSIRAASIVFDNERLNEIETKFTRTKNELYI